MFRSAYSMFYENRRKFMPVDDDVSAFISPRWCNNATERLSSHVGGLPTAIYIIDGG